MQNDVLHVARQLCVLQCHTIVACMQCMLLYRTGTSFCVTASYDAVTQKVIPIRYNMTWGNAARSSVAATLLALHVLEYMQCCSSASC